MRIEMRGRNVEVDDELREHVLKRFRRVGRQVSELAMLDVERLGRAQPLDRRQPGRRGDAAAQGGDAARQGGLARDGPHDPRTRRGHSPPGQEAPRAAPQAPPDATPGQPHARAHRRVSPGRPADSSCAVRAGRGTDPARHPPRYPWSMANARDMVTRALRVGEGRKFKAYEKRAETINAIEPEMELLDDDELRAEADSLRERARGGESLDDLLPEAFALTREAARRSHRPAPLRRAADRRHGAARRGDRRDEDRRGQDADGDPGRLPQHARGRQRPPRHRQRLPGAARRRMDEADLRRARGQRRRDPGRRRPRGAAGQIRLRRRLRHQLRVRLRLPARQHGRGARALRPARPPLRDRRRGRQHPDRRGADAADHLRRARTGGADLLPVRPPRPPDGRRPGQRPAEIAGRIEGHLRGRVRLRIRREAQDRLADRARRQASRGVPRRRQPLPERARHARQPPRARRSRPSRSTGRTRTTPWSTAR